MYRLAYVILVAAFLMGLLFLISPVLGCRMFKRYPGGLCQWVQSQPKLLIRLFAAGLAYASGDILFRILFNSFK